MIVRRRGAPRHGSRLAPIVSPSVGVIPALYWDPGGAVVLDVPDSHLQDALTWFGLALALFGAFGAWAWRQV